MGDKRKSAYPYRLECRVDPVLYHKLQGILAQSSEGNMSNLLRKILGEKRIRMVYRSESLDQLMEKLASLEIQVQRIGININQITREYHQSNGIASKMLKVIKVESALESLNKNLTDFKKEAKPLLDKWLQE